MTNNRPIGFIDSGVGGLTVVKEAIKQHQALYLVATGGVSAYLSTHVTKFELFLWPEFGAEAIYKMEVVDFPCYVSN